MEDGCLRDLYQEIILDHFKRPRRKFRLDRYDLCEKRTNPLCGDDIVLYINLEGGGRVSASFEGRGCAISQASASIMVDNINGKTIGECSALWVRYKEMMDDNSGHDPSPACDNSELEALRGIKRFPVRLRCADLAWQALESALTNEKLDSLK
ncbi:MAG: SUF system NifU family Fe-S cluster assembly protein [Oligoflexales bacterium]|nr:SUF system NifU family Fe-S cluster assembly protein [Oligoflexales bacterium]